MTSHEFAKLLLSGPDLPIVAPLQDDSDEMYAPVVRKVVGTDTSNDSPCDILVITRAALQTKEEQKQSSYEFGYSEAIKQIARLGGGPSVAATEQLDAEGELNDYGRGWEQACQDVINGSDMAEESNQQPPAVLADDTWLDLPDRVGWYWKATRYRDEDTELQVCEVYPTLFNQYRKFGDCRGKGVVIKYRPAIPPADPFAWLDIPDSEGWYWKATKFRNNKTEIVPHFVGPVLLKQYREIGDIRGRETIIKYLPDQTPESPFTA